MAFLRPAVFALLVLTLLSPLTAQQPVDPKLQAMLADKDAALFDAYNRCDLNAMRAFFAEDDLEFFHDASGIETSLDDLMSSVERNICGKTRRQLEPGTLEAWPLPGYGAVQTGKHRFFHVARDGKPESGGTVLARFLHIWKQIEGEWKITRVVSYAH